ncbi:PfaD family polyunsaturated fatty acid/polyketide biosynthesis protein [Clavibacter sp. VKM Ac-2542]|uniref:PfaD family polyunsaturated fatty acid/polyketide biosynthesis protein n=1 Tax=Clavibacter sp. VKM Ac-2542 TaxID=2783811 RepID=UPI00188B629D|nr:PfaD family polyunsaturated fatty acid/polyketide biosynthesis protein [Clavibacter sp. VKM Ac-2542]MBF4621306.1 PfaD family polyunsaturated fatty acid/polyketide biosynthesis protein [Clavibacter sp. VKM Ac-2542]
MTDTWGWTGPDTPEPSPEALARALHDVERPVFVVETPDGPAVASTGGLSAQPTARLLAAAGRVDPDALGSAAFRADHGVRAAYMAGAMAGGIASVELVAALANAGYLASYGAAGQLPEHIDHAVERIRRAAPGRPFAVNVIHSPSEAALEDGVVDVLLGRGVHLVEASAYLELTEPLVRYRLTGVHRTPDGRIVAPNRVIAKVSRPETARLFLQPPPAAIVRRLEERGAITAAEAALAGDVRMADDITAEADSGGHTDRRPLMPLLSSIILLRDRLTPAGTVGPRVGAAGGLGTPEALAAAFTMGAEYVVTGSVNQSCVESGTSDAARAMLAGAELTDFAMAPAADMFELGVELQVLRKGTMFPMRASRLLTMYRANASLEGLAAEDREWLERVVLRAPVEEVWASCVEYFTRRDPDQLTRAAGDPRRRMALVFRWYLGMASRWATVGEPGREADYQVWAGPALGAFNAWVQGTPLERPEGRRVALVADLLLRGAAVATRATVLTASGVRTGAVDAWRLLDAVAAHAAGPAAVPDAAVPASGAHR